MPRILFQTGGPYHPVAAQAEIIRSWLPEGWTLETADGAAVFDRLDDADLYVAAGLHWTGLDTGKHLWPEGVAPQGYVSPSPARREAFRRYVASGRPVLGFHGGIASHDDWPDYGHWLGFRWDWSLTAHTAVADWTVEIASAHPVVAGLAPFTLNDELYYGVQAAPAMPLAVHALARPMEKVRFPMVITGEGGRLPGAGRCAYLANGHSLASFACPALRPLWLNTLRWLLHLA